METGRTSQGCCESFADRAFTVTAMLGAVGGAAAGAFLGAEASDVFPVLWGTLGTVLGSTAAAGVWYGLVRLWAGDGVEHNPRAEQNSARSRALSPTTSA